MVNRKKSICVWLLVLLLTGTAGLLLIGCEPEEEAIVEEGLPEEADEDAVTETEDEAGTADSDQIEIIRVFMDYLADAA